MSEQPEPPADAIERSLPNGDGDGDRPERGSDGRFLPGNQAARQLGLYARQQPVDLRAAADRFTAGLAADLGGADEPSTLEAGYIDRLRVLDTSFRIFVADIDRRGLLTPSGGVRNVYDALLAGIDRFDRLAKRLGLQRRQKRVTSIAEVLAEYARRDEQQVRDARDSRSSTEEDDGQTIDRSRVSAPDNDDRDDEARAK